MSNEFWESMQFKLGRDVRLFVQQFSDEEKILLEWIKKSNDEILHSLLSIFEGRWVTSLPAMNNWLREVYEKQDQLSEMDREVAAILMIQTVRRYGSNSLNVFSGYTHYENILAANHEKIAARSKQKAPKVASVKAREKSIADMLMQEAQAAAGVSGVPGVQGNNKGLALDVLKSYLTKQIGTKASKMVVKKFTSKAAQRTFRSVLGWVGVALVVKDVYDFAGEASRVTMPFVINVSIYRSIEN